MPDTVLPRANATKTRSGKPRSSGRVVAARGPPSLAAGFSVVAVGASAGGLKACNALLDALPASTGMAFIVVQHLDPTHKSLLVELLAEHTAMPVLQAADGMLVERDHVYVIPPGSYLTVRGGALCLSAPQARHGVRLPFDALLLSLAAEYGARTVGVVLSGTGADGSAGLRAVKDAGGQVLVQDPTEAGADGMPRSAIATGLVDAVLPLSQMPSAMRLPSEPVAPRTLDPPPASAQDTLPDIIQLLRDRTKHDFEPYKQGTLIRRIERRMAMSALGSGTGGASRYLALLRSDDAELDALARDLLIHVTGFFRDPAVYAALAATVIPGMLQSRAPGQPLRVWIAGCSTGEEAYSLVILFHEAIAAAGDDVKLQVFASDLDPDAIAAAREGVYADAVAADVSAERLARFFCKEDGGGYRVLPELRAVVVFTVQDLLADPPFSRLDLLSCRNLMIYLDPDAQAKAVALFHFALREGGVLLLGTAETVSTADGRFEVMSKPDRLYRHVGRKRPGDLAFASSNTQGPRAARPVRAPAPSRLAVLADLCRQLVLDGHAPAAVLCNAKLECLYSLGPIDRYLRVAPGHSTPDVVAMARGAVRTRLRTALGRALQEGARVTIPGGRLARDGHMVPFGIDVQPVWSDGEQLLLVCFIDGPAGHGRKASSTARDAQRIAELERELEAARTALEEGARTLEASGEEQRTINEETLSVNEEYQSTNEELLTSKEELQSLNEELTALNNQLQETLERQRTTSNDLQNILYSTDVATLFLDRDLNIRFFTPATKSLFRIIPGDVGRPLADLHSLAADTALPGDARAVLHDLEPVEREIETPGGIWFRRRILPYRTDSPRLDSRARGGVEGVVITFNDITRRKQAAAALEEAKHGAELANLAKSRFLAAASHDLRQPLQTLTLVQGMLARTVVGDEAVGMVHRLDETLSAMTGMLDTLLDLNQIEAGIVSAEVSDVRVGDLLDRLRGEFAYHAQAKALAFRVMPCSAVIRTDPRLLEQMVRNLLANALKYTEHGRVLLGCRRQGDLLRIEVWDTGIGIPDGEVQAIFEEYHQLGNEARERGRGLGLGLSIVRRLGGLLGHRVRVRSRPGKGSVFLIEVARVPEASPQPRPAIRSDTEAAKVPGHAGAVLVIEDDPDLRNLLQMLLHNEGHGVTVAQDGPAALDLVARGAVRPDLILADYNLPGGMTGLQTATLLQEALPGVPCIILTGDTSADTLRAVSQNGCTQLNKPIKPNDLMRIVEDLLAKPPKLAAPTHTPAAQADIPVIFVVDDDSNIRSAIRAVLEDDGRIVEDYATSEAFLAGYRPGSEGCLLIDAYLPGIGGIELLQRLRADGDRLPAIMITGNSDVPMAVQAMKAGASDFIEKPIGAPDLLASIARALDRSRDAGKLLAWRQDATKHIKSLTSRQRQIMDLVLAGHPSKNIAADLGISQRTVENHRASIMRKSGVKSLPALARLALAAAGPGRETDEAAQAHTDG